MADLDTSIDIHRRTEARLKIAYGIQQGACNPRPITAELAKAITTCFADGISPSEDDAVFLILHQLVHILANHDIACSSTSQLHRWNKAYKAAGAAMKED